MEVYLSYTQDNKLLFLSNIVCVGIVIDVQVC